MTRTRLILPLGFVASALAAGLPYWSLTYRQVSLPDSLYGPGLLVLFLATAVAQVSGASTFWRNVAVLGSSFPAIVMLRVMVEAAADPTSHNLWPFEIIIASLLGGLCALPGAVAGLTIVKIRSIGTR
jgi:hypothetical protein